jgi:SAM-dependent methyltransferase
MTDFKYVGSELEAFANVQNWKKYWSRIIQPYISGDVLEVGAGIGSNTPFLNSGRNGRWVCLEPDSRLIAKLSETCVRPQNGREIVCGTLKSLGTNQKFDTIIYIDVLEHIKNDQEELEHAASLLRVGGRIIVLSPAHQTLFTPFDAAIGHYRRYNGPMMRSISPRNLSLERLFYLDSAGLLLSAANLLLLRQSMPTRGQLRIWDGWVVPVSRILDRLLFNSVGKSIVGIWRQNEVVKGDQYHPTKPDCVQGV